jgi:Na+/proline symporter
MNEQKVRSNRRHLDLPDWPWSGIMLFLCLLGFGFLGSVFLRLLISPDNGLPLRLCHAAGFIIGMIVGIILWFLGLWLFATPPSDRATPQYRISD